MSHNQTFFLSKGRRLQEYLLVLLDLGWQRSRTDGRTQTVNFQRTQDSSHFASVYLYAARKIELPFAYVFCQRSHWSSMIDSVDENVLNTDATDISPDA